MFIKHTLKNISPFPQVLPFFAIYFVLSFKIIEMARSTLWSMSWLF